MFIEGNTMAVVHWDYGMVTGGQRGGYRTIPSLSCRTIPLGKAGGYGHSVQPVDESQEKIKGWRNKINSTIIKMANRCHCESPLRHTLMKASTVSALPWSFMKRKIIKWGAILFGYQLRASIWSALRCDQIWWFAYSEKMKAKISCCVN